MDNQVCKSIINPLLVDLYTRNQASVSGSHSGDVLIRVCDHRTRDVLRMSLNLRDYQP